MRYVRDTMLYVEPCPWCGAEVASVAYVRRPRPAVLRRYTGDGWPYIHECPPPRRFVPNERDFAPGGAYGPATEGSRPDARPAPQRAVAPPQRRGTGVPVTPAPRYEMP